MGISPELLRATAALHRVLASVAARDDAVRDGIAALGRWLIRIADDAEQSEARDSRPAHANGIPVAPVAPVAPVKESDRHGGSANGKGSAPGTATSQPDGGGAPFADAGSHSGSGAVSSPSAGTGVPSAAQSSTPAARPQVASASAAPVSLRPGSSGIVPLRLGDSVAEVAVRGNTHELIAATRAADLAGPFEAGVPADASIDDSEPDLDAIAQHSSFKARACRWGAERRRRIAAQVDFEASVKPTDARMIDEARRLECFAWTLTPYAKLPPDEALERLACLHENLTAAAKLACELKESSDPAAEELRTDAYQLLAEAQSALRKGLLDLGQQIDHDQDQAFHWLRRRTEEDRIFVRRHMRLTDPADPEGWADLRARIAASETGVRRALDAARTRRKAFSKLRYLCGQMESWPEEDRLRQWKTLAATVETLTVEGINPSDRELRELLLPLVDSIPDTVPDSIGGGPGFVATLRSIDRYIADLEASDDAPPRERLPSPEVREAADLLRGRVVVLIGGERRRNAAAALEQALELAELRWIGTIDHQSIAPFETEVARPDVALVLLPIRWINHSFEGIQEFCRRYDRPLVRLPAGYNPNRVALEVLRQAGDSLRAESAEPDSAGGGPSPQSRTRQLGR